MEFIDILEIIYTLLSLLRPLIIIGIIIAIVITKVKSSGNTKYPKANMYNNQYNRPYNMNQNGYNNQYRQPYNMNQNGYNNPNGYNPNTFNNQNGYNNQLNNQYNMNQNVNNQAAYNATTNANAGHNHAYEHKVTPIQEASVIEKSEDRKEAYLDRKQQMKADLPKTSYSRMEAMDQTQSSASYTSSAGGHFGYSSDSMMQVSPSQERVICKNCGAENIVPASRSTAYSCYFCKETL